MQIPSEFVYQNASYFRKGDNYLKMGATGHTSKLGAESYAKAYLAKLRSEREEPKGIAELLK